MFQEAGRAARRGAPSTPGCADLHAQQVTERKIIPSPLQEDANLPAATLLLCYELTHAHCLRLPRGAFMVSHKPWNGMRSVHYYINTGRHSHFVSDCYHDWELGNSWISTLVALSQTCLHCKLLFVCNSFSELNLQSSFAHCIAVCMKARHHFCHMVVCECCHSCFWLSCLINH